MSAPKRLRFKEAADYVGIPESTFKTLHYRGRGPAFFKVGARILFEARDIDEWLAGCRRTPAETGARTAS